MPAYESFKGYFSRVLRFDPKTMELEPLKEGSKVTAGTVLGRIGKTDELAPHVHFAIRPAGRGAPKIDPKPILDGWKLLEATAIYRAAGKNPFDGAAHRRPGAADVEAAADPARARRPALEIYACGRSDIRTGQIDRRVLAMLEFLAARGYRLTITSLKCGHSVLTTSGNVSRPLVRQRRRHRPDQRPAVLGNQGPGTITEALVKDLLQLQGTMKPHQIISLMDYFGADNTFAMGDHDDHVHVGYMPHYGPAPGSVSKQFNQILKPDQWERLIDRLGEIDNPTVPTSPSDAALPAGKDKDRSKKSDEARLERPPRRVARDAALPLRPARARRHGRARGRPLPRPRPRAGARRPGRRRPAPPPAPARPGEAEGRRARTPTAPAVPRTTLTAIRPDAARRARTRRRPGSPACATTPRRSRRRSRTRLELINRAVHAHRAATLDPAIADVAAERRARRPGRLRQRRGARRRPLHARRSRSPTPSAAAAASCCAPRSGSPRCSAARRRSPPASCS